MSLATLLIAITVAVLGSGIALAQGSSAPLPPNEPCPPPRVSIPRAVASGDSGAPAGSNQAGGDMSIGSGLAVAALQVDDLPGFHSTLVDETSTSYIEVWQSDDCTQTLSYGIAWQFTPEAAHQAYTLLQGVYASTYPDLASQGVGDEDLSFCTDPVDPADPSTGFCEEQFRRTAIYVNVDGQGVPLPRVVTLAQRIDDRLVGAYERGAP
ncbi:MAG: hypothetical protein ACR2PL_07090 [Dehalococcoidia bacterium]